MTNKEKIIVKQNFDNGQTAHASQYLEFRDKIKSVYTKETLNSLVIEGKLVNIITNKSVDKLINDVVDSSIDDITRASLRIEDVIANPEKYLSKTLYKQFVNEYDKVDSHTVFLALRKYFLNKTKRYSRFIIYFARFKYCICKFNTSYLCNLRLY